MKPNPYEHENYRRILVRAPNWIGDQILAYSFFHYLRTCYPVAHIAVACVPWVQAVQFSHLVDEVLVLPRPLDQSWPSRWSAIEMGAKILKDAGPWDLGISMPNSLSAAWLLFRAGVRKRRGFKAEGRSLLLNQGIELEDDPILHRSETYLRLLPEARDHLTLPATEFWGVLPENELDPGQPGVISQLDLEKAWPQAEMIEPPDEPYWILAPGSNAESRRWPIERFTALAELILEETGWTGIVIGGVGEGEAAEYLMNEIAARKPKAQLLDWTGRGTVASYGKIFRSAKFSVCNDSGLAHVASICGSPVQVIWGAGDLKRTEPTGPGKVQVSLNPVDCWPCEKNHCALGVREPSRKIECLRGIYADSVWQQLKTGLRPF